jgi:Tfp pilus assembly protein PilN
MSDCDFIPARYRDAWALRRALKLRASGVGMLAVIMALWVVAHQHRVSSAQAMVAGVEQQDRQIQIHLAKKQQMEVERAALESRQRLIEQLEAGTDLVVVFSDISGRMPDTIVLTSITAHCPALSRYAAEEASSSSPEELPATPSVPPALHNLLPAATRSALSKSGMYVQPPKPPENATEWDSVTMIGIARELPDVIAFAAALENSRLFNRVQMEMKEPVVWAGRKAQQFEIRCDLARQVGGHQ